MTLRGWVVAAGIFPMVPLSWAECVWMPLQFSPGISTSGEEGGGVSFLVEQKYVGTRPLRFQDLYYTCAFSSYQWINHL